MKTNKLFEKRLIFSAELFPPKKSGNLEGVIRALRDIKNINPDFVSITYGAGGHGGETTADVASIAKDAFDFETVAHLTCVNLTKDKLESELEILRRKNIENILVLRGDIAKDTKFYDFNFANELAYYLSKNHPEFNLLGACYPEKHPQAQNLDTDIDNLKRKVDCGVTQLITQLFYDNECFYEFREKLRKANISVPLQAGIMPLTSKKVTTKIVELCGAKIPSNLNKIIVQSKDDELYQNGIDYAINQIEDLRQNRVDGIHLYTMNKADVAVKIFEHFNAYR